MILLLKKQNKNDPMNEVARTSHMPEINANIKVNEKAVSFLTSNVPVALIKNGLRTKRESMDQPPALTSSNLSKLTHEELVALIAHSKSKKAFKILFDYFAPRLKSYLLNFKISNQKAEDITQEVMIVLWHKADKFNPEKAKISTWLFRVARNKYIDSVRRQKYPMVNSDDHMHEMVAPEKTDRNIEQVQNSDLIRNAMKTLNDDQQKVIELSFFHELSHSQIAEKTGLPLGTVKSRIRMAFTALRNELGDHK